MDARKNNLSLLIGGIGLVLQVAGLFVGIIQQDANPDVFPAVGIAICWLGAALLIVGLALYASAKGQHWAWGFMGLLSIIGLIILAALPDREHERKTLESMSVDATQPAIDDGPVLRCAGCGYILSGISASTCPECGRPYDASNLASMRVTDVDGRDWLDKDRIPWTARWSLICGLFSIVLVCTLFFNLVSALCGIGFGHHARHVIAGRPNMRRTSRVALAGLITSYIGLVLSIATVIFLITSIR